MRSRSVSTAQAKRCIVSRGGFVASPSPTAHTYRARDEMRDSDTGDDDEGEPSGFASEDIPF